MRRKLVRRVAALSAAVSVSAGLLSASAARAASATWGGTADSSWDTTGNWTFDAGAFTEPDGTHDVTFPAGTPQAGAGAVTLTAGELANSLTFGANYTLSGGSLLLTAGTVTVGSGFTATLDTSLGGSNGLTLPTVALGGGGTVALRQVNSFTGNVAVNGGTLDLLGQGSADPTLLGSGAKTVTLNGGRLSVTNMLGAATGGFNPSSASKTFSIAAGGATFHVDTSVNTNVAVTFDDASQISGAGLITKTGPGTMSLGSNGTGYTGLTGGARVEGGTLSLNNTNALGGVATSAITLAGGNLNLRFDSSTDYKNNVTVQNNGTIDVNRNNTSSTNGTLTLGTLAIGAQTLTVSGGNGYALSFGGATTLSGTPTINNTTANVTMTNVGQTGGTHGLNKSGAGILILNGTGAYGGNTVATAGTIRANDGAGLPSAGNLSLNAAIFETGAAFNRSAGTGGGEVQITGGTAGFSANGASAVTVALGGTASPTPLTWGTGGFAPGTLVLQASTASQALNFQNDVNLNGAARTIAVNANTATINGLISNSTGTFGFTKSGGGTLVLTNAANSYNGNTTVTGGTLSVSDLTPGPTSNVGAGNVVLGNGATLNYTGGSVTTGKLAMTGSNISTTVNVTNAATDLNVTSSLNSMTLTKNGPGTLTIAGTGDNASGNLTVNAGTVVLAKTSSASVHAAAQVNAVLPGTTLRLGGTGNDQIYHADGTAGRGINNMNGTFDMNGRSEETPYLKGYGTVTNDGASGTTSTLTVGSMNVSGEFLGKFQDGASGGKVALTKTGTGTFTVSNGHAYTGATTINGGTLRLKYVAAAPVAGSTIWYDANDDAGVIEAGGTVSQWTDKAGGNQNATQATAANQPTRVASALVGGKKVLRFDGSNDVFGADLTPLNGSAYTIFAVEARSTGAKVPNYYIGTSGATTTNNSLHTGYRDNTTYTNAQYSNDINVTGLAAYDQQFFRLWTNELATTAAGTLAAGRYVFLDGNQVGSTASTGVLGSITPTNGRIGGGRSASEFYQGDLAEMLIYTSALTPEERIAVEQYLQAKWFGGGTTAGNVLPASTALSIGANSTLDLNGVTQTVASLASAASTSAVLLGGGTLTVGDATSTTFAGVISGPGGLTKQGAGSFTLTGANTFAGTTTVLGGTLVVGSGGTGSVAGAVSVLAAGTLGGSGTIGGLLTSAGTIAPGNSPGTLTVNNSADLEDGSFLTFDLDDASAAAGAGGNDLLAILGTSGTNGDLAIGTGLTVNVLAGTNFGEGVYELVTYTGSLTDNSGGFSGWTVAGAPGGYEYTFAASGGSLNLVVAVPEPAALGLLGIAGAALLGRRRRRA